ncbi:DMT family transporter [bacterium]|nr:MAG: DMT family transporter [bacterium]
MHCRPIFGGSLSVGILFGILAALCWGFGDYLITLLTRRIGNERSLVWTQIASLLLWLVMLVALGSPKFSADSIPTVLLAGALHVVGLKLTYRAFEVGTLSIVSPLASGFAIVTAVLVLIFGHAPNNIALAGAGLLVVGIAFATGGDTSGPKSLKGVPEAIGSALAFGGMFYLFEGIESTVGYVGPLVVLKTLATLTFSLPQLKTVFQRVDLSPSVLGLTVGVAAMDTGAWLFYLYGLKSESGAIVTAVASLFSVVTVILAVAFFKERLKPAQWAGIALVLVGILVVSWPKNEVKAEPLRAGSVRQGTANPLRA